MNTKDFKAKLKQENADINIDMSDSLKSTKIETRDEFVSECKRKPLFFKLAVCFTCFLFAAICLCGIFIPKQDTAVGLTSYILEINPSICITTDKNDNVINICALNDDANEIVTDQILCNFENLNFDECLGKLMYVIKKQGYFDNFGSDDRSIKLYAINDSNETQYQRLEHFEEIMKSKMNELGYLDVPFEKHRIGMDDFKEIVGFDEEYKTLDDMQDYFRKRDVRFPLPPQ